MKGGDSTTETYDIYGDSAHKEPTQSAMMCHASKITSFVSLYCGIMSYAANAFKNKKIKS